MISTKGRYALRIMIDLAEQCTDGYLPMKDVAQRQDISLKYIEQIMPFLKRVKLVEGVHGKGGGYRLCREPEQYTVWEILTAAEGDMAPVSCLKCDADACRRAAECRTLGMWTEYYRMMREYFTGITLADLMKRGDGGDYVI